jgi:uncharacterized protein YoaH (UPF0181 family)
VTRIIDEALDGMRMFAADADTRTQYVTDLVSNVSLRLSGSEEDLQVLERVHERTVGGMGYGEAEAAVAEEVRQEQEREAAEAEAAAEE